MGETHIQLQLMKNISIRLQSVETIETMDPESNFVRDEYDKRIDFL